MPGEDQPFAIFKICLLGAGGVGKTCIAKRLCFNTFDINSKLTIGIDFYTYHLPIIVDGVRKYVNLLIWDFGGQEQFKRLFPYYINGANGIFMCFSLISLQTLVNLEWWYERLKEEGHNNTTRVLVGTKQDLIEGLDDMAVVDEGYIDETMERYGETNFIRTSAKNDVNVKKIFREITKNILDKNKLKYDELPEE